MAMEDIEALVGCGDYNFIKFAAWGPDGKPTCSQSDHATAFRWWAVRRSDICLAVSLVPNPEVGPHGGFSAFPQKALPFGALGAVWGYTRVALAIDHNMGRLFGMAQSSWVDDFLRMAPLRHAAPQAWAFNAVHDL